MDDVCEGDTCDLSLRQLRATARTLAAEEAKAEALQQKALAALSFTTLSERGQWYVPEQVSVSKKWSCEECEDFTGNWTNADNDTNTTLTITDQDGCKATLSSGSTSVDLGLCGRMMTSEKKDACVQFLEDEQQPMMRCKSGDAWVKQ